MLTSMPTKTDFDSIKEILQREFIRRCKMNPAYSLRAYSNYLEVDQSFLSKILNGKRQITPRLANALAEKLGINPTEVKTSKMKSQAMGSYLSLTNEEFEFLSDWTHFAILELSKTKNFRYEPKVIAARLGLHEREVTEAVERLVKLKFVRIDAKKFFVLARNNSWSNTKATTTARQIFQRNLIKKSLDAIDQVPFEFRDHGSVTLAIDKNRLPEFKEKLLSIRRELADFIQPDSAKNLNEVYQLTISFFPLTKISGAG